MRILILTSSTGGGHNMRASSFVHWTREVQGHDAAKDIEIHKCLENTHGLYRFGVGLYNRIQRHVPWAHHVYFNFLEVAGLHYSRQRLLGVDRFRAVLDDVRPDVVLSTHGSLNHGFFDLAREHLGRANVRCVTYCGELFGRYGFSRHWVNPKADLFIGAVPETCAMARSLGMPAERCTVGGFLLNPSFYRPALTPDERATLLRGMGLDPARFTLLLSTGEHGANNHIALLEALRIHQPRKDLQVIALCGRAPRVLERLREWSKRNPSVPLKALPHSHIMHLLMQASSAILARPGTGTTSEAIISGCPIIFNSLGGFMPQEWITMRYARRHGFAQEVVHRPATLVDILARWTAEPERYARTRQQLIDCRPPQHPTDILRMVSDLPAGNSSVPTTPPPRSSSTDAKRSPQDRFADKLRGIIPTS